ncbi:MAG: stage II sporulation protein M [Bacilli bacterium]
MKKEKNAFQKEIQKNKYKYIFLLTIILIGFISGIIFSNILSYNDHQEISNTLKDYFLGIKNNQSINYLGNFLNIFSVNYLYMLLIWIFGLSIIGIILNPFILYFKSFVIGFSVGIIISVYSYLGILGSLLYLFPHLLINLLVYTLLSFYGIKLSIKLFKALFLHKNFNFQELVKKYLKILGLASIILLITTLYETFLADFVMKIFTFFLK